MNQEERKSFGIYLKELRVLSGLSLREVEKATNKAVSNAYISQIESGKIETPSPHILDKLAAVYGVPHREIMEAAGYIRRASGEKKLATSGIQFSLKQNLTNEEREEVVRFLEYLRFRKGKKKQ